MKRFELSTETANIVRYLQMLDKGTVVTYPELSKIAGIPLAAKNPRLIYARKILQRDHNAVWGCVRPNIGVQRFNDTEIAERQRGFWLNGARNKLARGGDEAEVVDLNELDIDERVRFSVAGVQREIAKDALSKSSRRKIENVARGNSNDLPSFNIVEWAINLSQPRKTRFTETS
jgi:alkylated DNA nucleotide flippase Atl1